MYVDDRQYKAFCRMTRHDMLPAYKRYFAHRNSDFFTSEEIKKHDIKILLAARARRVSQIMKKLYGPDHPAVIKEEGNV